MGKKDRKRKREAATSTSEGLKRSRTSAAEPPNSPTPPPRPILIRYEDMPLNHKRKFHINDDCGSASKYVEVLSWLRTMGCFEGTVFEGIQNLNWVAGGGYPLVEVEVVSPDEKSSKFIFIKSTLYIIAFLAYCGWYQFSVSEYRIDGFNVLQDYSGSYGGEPWKHVGPQCMITALDRISLPDVDVDVSALASSCETFFVHLSEAARLYPVQSLVCRSLAQPDTGIFEKRPYEAEERFILDVGGGQSIGENDDVLSLVRGVGSINFSLRVQTPNFIECLIRKFSLMSKAWYVYSLSRRNVLEMRSDHVLKLHMRSRKSLRCTLAVLCNINLDKVLLEWEKKSKRHPLLTHEVYKEMEMEVHKLQAEKKVFLPPRP